VNTLSESDSRKLKEFLSKFQDVFSKSSSDIGYTELIQHGINTGNAPPIKTALISAGSNLAAIVFL
jgi:hypothetical protein